MMMPYSWSYAVTTCHERHDLLPRTLSLLSAAGFPYPLIVTDNGLRIFGNWVRALWEIYVRQPDVDLYAIFQDDILICRNVRQHLDRLKFPNNGFWGLYAAMDEEAYCPKGFAGGFIKGCQRVRGALALVLGRAAVVELLSSRDLVMKPQDKQRGRNGVDGIISSVLCQSELQRYQYIHFPSLVQHSEEGIKGPTLPERYTCYGYCFYPPAQTFPGVEFDALTLPVNG